MDTDMAKMIWQNDIYLSEAAKHLDEIDVVSFDVFDTLLLRTLAAPRDVFTETGKRLQGMAKQNPFPPEVFAGLRCEADARARKKAWEAYGYEDVTLDEIYREFNKDEAYGSAAKECELAVERESVYLNPNVMDFISYCYHRKKKIALVSDTYFSRQQVEELLTAAGFALRFVHRLIVSSEYRRLKYNGKLFQTLLDAFPSALPSRILHIGDSRNADIDGANIAGLQSFHYNMLPQSLLHYMSVERNRFGCCLHPVASLRKLAAGTVPGELRQPQERALFETGCSVFGVVYTFFAEWIIQQAQNNGIKTIIAFLREGELLSEIIKRTARFHGTEIKVTPIYISRRTTEIVRIGEIGEQSINAYLHRPQLKIGELFSIFYLDIADTPFQEIGMQTIAQCKEQGHFEDLSGFLKSGAVIDRINLNIAEQKQLLAEYIRSVTDGADAITVDVGFRGTMQDSVSHVSEGGRFLHLMLMGIQHNIPFLLDGVELRGWLGYAGENLGLIETIYRRIQVVEAVTNADIGTTIRYAKKDARIVPVLEAVSIDDANKQSKRILWDGIFHFQDAWFMLQSKKPELLEKMLACRDEFLKLLLRFLTMPTFEEAQYLGQLYYDESILNSMKSRVCTPADFDLFERSANAQEFLELCESGAAGEVVYWPEAVAVRKAPAYFQQIYLNALPDTCYKKAYRLLHREKLLDKRVAVYGAGKNGRTLVEAANELEVAIACIVDADPRLQGTSIHGVRVLSPEQSVGLADAYVITPIHFEQEIRDRLYTLYQNHESKPYMITYE